MREIDSPISRDFDDGHDHDEHLPFFDSRPNNAQFNEGSGANISTARRRQNTNKAHQSLHSQSYGGYGPVPLNDINFANGQRDKFHGRKVLSGMKSIASNFVQTCGCSAEEMLRGEGEGGDYYRDPFNDESWSCSFGTGEENGIWMNASDQSGTIMSFLVWFLIGTCATSNILGLFIEWIISI